MNITRLTADQLTAAVIRFVGDFEPTRIPRAELTQMFAAFLMPLTHDGIKPEHVGKLVTAANDYHHAIEASLDPMEIMDEKGGSWARHAQKSRRRVEVIAAAICDGGRPE